MNGEKDVVRWMLAIIILLLLIFTATLYVRAETTSPTGCISHVGPGREPEVRCNVLWLAVVSTGGDE